MFKIIQKSTQMFPIFSYSLKKNVFKTINILKMNMKEYAFNQLINISREIKLFDLNYKELQMNFLVQS